MKDKKIKIIMDEAEPAEQPALKNFGPRPQGGGLSEHLLVCITSSPSSEKLVRSAHRIAEKTGARWTVVYVETLVHLHSVENNRHEAIQHLHLAEQLGAKTAILNGLDFNAEVLKYCREQKVTNLVLGNSFTLSSFSSWFLGSHMGDLFRKNQGMDVFILYDGPEEKWDFRNDRLSFNSGWRSYGFALGVLVICNLLAWASLGRLDLTNVLMIYLIGILAVVAKAGKGPSTLACILGVLSFDFFMVPPQMKFASTDSQYLITLVVVTGFTLMISELVTRARSQNETIRQREDRATSLFSLSRKMAVSRGIPELLQTAVKHISEIFDGETVILMPGEDRKLARQAGLAGPSLLDPQEQAVIQWVFRMGSTAGAGTNNHPDAKALYLPLIFSGGPLGVLGLRPRNPRHRLSNEQIQLLQALANQIGASIENERLLEESSQARLQYEIEQHRSALLSSVSHDLRTPLAVITGSASIILETKERLDQSTLHLLSKDIYDESERLNRLLNNLLEMTRFNSGAVQPKKELQPLEEVVGTALARLKKRLEGRSVQVHLPEDLPMVPLDCLLMEQVFINLLENAVKYTPEGSPIGVTASIRRESLKVVVSDSGPGFAEGDEERIFEKFYRGSGTDRKGGAGLGLAICRAVVAAHGGKIWAENRPEGGAGFCFTLPLDKDAILPDSV